MILPYNKRYCILKFGINSKKFINIESEKYISFIFITKYIKLKFPQRFLETCNELRGK